KPRLASPGDGPFLCIVQGLLPITIMEPTDEHAETRTTLNAIRRILTTLGKNPETPEATRTGRFKPAAHLVMAGASATELRAAVKFVTYCPDRALLQYLALAGSATAIASVLSLQERPSAGFPKQRTLLAELREACLIRLQRLLTTNTEHM